MLTATVNFTKGCSNHFYYSAGCLDCLNVIELTKIKLKHGYHDLKIDHGNPSPKLQMIRQQYQTKLTLFLREAAHKAAKAGKKRAEEVIKATGDELNEIALSAYREIAWEDIVDDSIAVLQEANGLGGMDGISQLAIASNLVPDMTTRVQDAAAEYARQRAAEMIGKKYQDGELINSDRAEFVIADTTRDDLKDLVEQAFVEGMSSEELAAAILEATTFSATRAQLIAKTEIAMAQVQGNLGVWQRSGMVKKVNIILSADHSEYDICDIAANGGPYSIDEMPFIPRHPRCECVIMASEIIE